jgi:hypothetical protein
MSDVKVFVSKTQLKKFKVNAENCGTYETLLTAGYVAQPSEELALETMKELEKFNILYTVKRKCRL